MHHLRKIQPDELPTVFDVLAGGARQLAPDDVEGLLQFGLVRVGDNLYDCAHTDGRPEPEWGDRFTGPGRDRYNLPSAVKSRVQDENRWSGEL